MTDPEVTYNFRLMSQATVQRELYPSAGSTLAITSTFFYLRLCGFGYTCINVNNSGREGVGVAA